MLVEFVADLFPNSGILSADPVQRAQTRFFIEGVSSKLIPAWYAYFLRGASVDDLYTAAEYVQSLLPAEGFAVGKFSAADIAIAPFLARARVSLVNEIGKYPEGDGKKVWAALTSGKFARLGKYAEDLFARESFSSTFDEVSAVIVDFICNLTTLLDRIMSRRRSARVSRTSAASRMRCISVSFTNPHRNIGISGCISVSTHRNQSILSWRNHNRDEARRLSQKLML